MCCGLDDAESHGLPATMCPVKRRRCPALLVRGILASILVRATRVEGAWPPLWRIR